MFCPKCGAKIEENATFCSECGNSLNEETVVVNNTNTQSMQEGGSTFGWGILGFFFPIIGLILFLVWKKDKPKSSKSAGIGALIGFILGIVFYILIFIFAFAVGYSGVSSSIYY